MVLSRAALKALWIQGYMPLEADYVNLFDSFMALIDDLSPKNPVISGGTLTLDCLSQFQILFEPLESVGVLPIDIDFTVAITNATNAKLISMILTLTGTRIITFPADVLVSIPSSIGVWSAPNLTLSAGTNDIIEIQMLRYTQSSNWLLKVAEKAV